MDRRRRSAEGRLAGDAPQGGLDGCLHVLPGPHREAIHEHVPDRRPDANVGYVEIVEHEMSGASPVTDLLVFHSHPMHRSTDNGNNGCREAMVFHGASRGTRNLEPQETPVDDWMPLTGDR